MYTNLLSIRVSRREGTFRSYLPRTTYPFTLFSDPSAYTGESSGETRLKGEERRGGEGGGTYCDAVLPFSSFLRRMRSHGRPAAHPLRKLHSSLHLRTAPMTPPPVSLPFICFGLLLYMYVVWTPLLLSLPCPRLSFLNVVSSSLKLSAGVVYASSSYPMSPLAEITKEATTRNKRKQLVFV